MSDPVNVAAFGRVVDGRGGLDAVEQALADLRDRGVEVRQLVVDPLSAGWHTPTQPGHFRSGAAPAMAVHEACRLIRAGEARAVLVSGDEPLRSGYSREQRAQMMDIYDGVSLPEAYTQLADAYMARRGWDEASFLELSHALFDNCLRTAVALGIAGPDASRYELVTRLYRGVDCANPVVDFQGRLLLVADELEMPATVKVDGVGFAALAHDGPAAVADIARFDHMRAAFGQAMEEAGASDFIPRFRAGDAALEVYTCFPVMPIAALLETGIAKDANDLWDLLAERPVTVTAGMNLGRGPWNNPTLNALVAMCEKLATAGEPDLGVVHGNGGLGYRQGWVVLRRH